MCSFICLFEKNLLNTCPVGLELGQCQFFLGTIGWVGGQRQWDITDYKGQRAGMRQRFDLRGGGFGRKTTSSKWEDWHRQRG